MCIEEDIHFLELQAEDNTKNIIDLYNKQLKMEEEIKNLKLILAQILKKENDLCFPTKNQ